MGDTSNGGKRTVRTGRGKVSEYVRRNGKGYVNGKEVIDKPPKGWKVDSGVTTRPVGTTAYTNGKSRFSGERKTVLVKDKDFYKIYKAK